MFFPAGTFLPPGGDEDHDLIGLTPQRFVAEFKSASFQLVGLLAQCGDVAFQGAPGLMQCEPHGLFGEDPGHLRQEIRAGRSLVGELYQAVLDAPGFRDQHSIYCRG